jgi:hypothetical protein
VDFKALCNLCARLSPATQPGVAAGVLALAGTVAHTSERKFAPIASFVAGIAVERLTNAGVLSTEQDVVDFIGRLMRGSGGE